MPNPLFKVTAGVEYEVDAEDEVEASSIIKDMLEEALDRTDGVLVFDGAETLDPTAEMIDGSDIEGDEDDDEER